MLARRRTDVDHVVGRADRLLVVLDDDQRVAQVAEANQGVDQPSVVALVQPDRRLVEDVEDAHQLRANLRGQPDALRLAARQCVGRAVHCQVLEPNVDHELQALADLLEDSARDDLLALRASELLEELDGRADRVLADLRDVLPVDGHRQRLGLQAPALAGRTRLVRHVPLELLLQVLGLSLLVAALQVRDHAFERCLVPALVAVLVAVAELDLLVAGAIEKHVALLLGQLRPWLVHGDAEVLADCLQQLRVEELRLAPGGYRALVQGQ